MMGMSEGARWQSVRGRGQGKETSGLEAGRQRDEAGRQRDQRQDDSLKKKLTIMACKSIMMTSRKLSKTIAVEHGLIVAMMVVTSYGSVSINP